MFVGGNILYGLAVVAESVLTIYMWVVVARALISWVSPDPGNPIVRFLDIATEPALAPIRRFLYRVGWRGGIDVSPIILILVIIFLQYALVSTLYQLATQMNPRTTPRGVL